jgi:3-aminobutyryl-CoA ammonia-lyase
VQFLAPVRAGDVVEIEASLHRAGRRSREIRFVARVMCRGRTGASADESAGAADVLQEPLVATTATGTVVVPTPAG